MGLFTEREPDNKIQNWIARKGNVMAFVFVVFGWTSLMFLLGAIWQLEQDLKAIKQIDITTKIVEYRLGTTTIHKDTIDVVKYKMK